MGSLNWRLWQASEVVRLHAAGGRCQRCPPAGTCPLAAECDRLLQQWQRHRDPEAGQSS